MWWRSCRVESWCGLEVWCVLCCAGDGVIRSSEQGFGKNHCHRRASLDVGCGAKNSKENDSMKKSPSWKADSHSDGKEICRPEWNPKFHYRVYKCPPLDLVVSLLIPVHTLTFCFFKTQFNIILPSTTRSFNWFLPFRHSLLPRRYRPLKKQILLNAFSKPFLEMTHL
jgi:uncharacterized membrane protein